MKASIKEKTWADKSFDILNGILIFVVFFVTIYPIIVIISSSFSSAESLMAGKVVLWPVDFTLDGYKAVFKNESIWTGMANSVFYTVAGTLINLILTVLAAYPLSRRDFKAGPVISFVFAFTMWFSGGLIPTYLLVKDLGFINSRLAMLIPGAINVWNMVIVRTYFQTNIAGEMLEAAKIDGCSDYQFLWRIAIPLSKPTLAVITLYYAVAHWNAFAVAYIYLQNPKLYPIQVVLRDILLLNQTQEMAGDVSADTNARLLSELLKYAVVVVASLPMAIIYPFVQKHFVKGIMIGGVKG